MSKVSIRRRSSVSKKKLNKIRFSHPQCHEPHAFAIRSVLCVNRCKSIKGSANPTSMDKNRVGPTRCVDGKRLCRKGGCIQLTNGWQVKKREEKKKSYSNNTWLKIDTLTWELWKGVWTDLKRVGAQNSRWFMPWEAMMGQSAFIYRGVQLEFQNRSLLYKKSALLPMRVCKPFRASVLRLCSRLTVKLSQYLSTN